MVSSQFPIPVHRSRWLLPQLMLILLMCLMAGCASIAPSATPTPPVTETPLPPAIGSCTLGLGAGASDADAIRSVLHAEGELMVAQSIEQLMLLWDEDGRVVNAKNTPADESDDQLWIGKDAVRHRYVRIVFPGAAAAAAPADMDVAVTGDSAVVTATTHIGSEISPAGDRWQLNKVSGCWVIERLVFNLEPAQ